MEQIVSTTFTQILKLFIFVALGYLCGKKRVFPPDGDRTLSLLCTRLLLPAMFFGNFCRQFTAETMHVKLKFLLLGAAVLLASFALSYPLSRLFTRDKAHRPVHLYCLTIPNTGYMGLPLVLAVLGEAMLSNYVVFTIPYSILICSVFTLMLDPGATFSPRSFLTPTNIAMVLGMLCGLTGFNPPALIAEAVDLLGSCMSPIAMLALGMTLSTISLRDVFTQKSGYLMAGIRLLGLPLFFFLVLYLVGVRGDLLFICVATLALPVGANAAVLTAAYGGDSQTGARYCFITHLLSLFTLPLVFGLLKLLA